MNARYPELKARFAALGYQLLEGQGDKSQERFYVTRPEQELVVGIGMTIEAVESFCADLEEDARTTKRLTSEQSSVPIDETKILELGLMSRTTADEQSVLYGIQGVTLAIAQEVHQLDFDEDEGKTMLAGLTIALEVLADMLPAKL